MEASQAAPIMGYNQYIEKLEKKEPLTIPELRDFKSLIKINNTSNLTLALGRLKKASKSLSNQETNSDLQKQLSKLIKKIETTVDSIFKKNNCIAVDSFGELFSINKQELQEWSQISHFFQAQEDFTNTKTAEYINLSNTKNEISSFLSVISKREELSFYNIYNVFVVAETTQCPEIQNVCVHFLRSNENRLESCEQSFKKIMYEMISRSPMGLKEIQDDIEELKRISIEPKNWTSYQGREDGKTRYISQETYTQEEAQNLAKKWNFKLMGIMSQNGIYRLRMVPSKRWKEIIRFCSIDPSICRSNVK